MTQSAQSPAPLPNPESPRDRLIAAALAWAEPQDRSEDAWANVAALTAAVRAYKAALLEPASVPGDAIATTLTWRSNDLYAGDLSIGRVWQSIPFATGRRVIVSQLMIEEIKYHHSESLARSALEAAARRALAGEV